MEVAGIPGFWADLDTTSEGDKKQRFESKRHIREWLAALTLPPTVVVDSGHGYQPWWLFEFPENFKSPRHRNTVAGQARDFHNLLQDLAPEGVILDSVCDLSRILRLPGSRNVKGKPVKVVLTAMRGPRYTGAGRLLDGMGVDTTPKQTTPAKVPRKQNPPRLGTPGIAGTTLVPERLAMLWEIDPLALAAWSGAPAPWLKDPSPSARDMSVATRAALAGWPESEIVSLIHQGRAARGDAPKHDQAVTLTVTKASQTASQSDNERAAEEVYAGAEAPTPEMKWALLSEVMGIRPPIEKLDKLDTDPPEYRLFWSGQGVGLGDAGTLINQGKFRQRIAELTGILINRMKADKWDPIVQGMLSLAEVIEVGGEGDEFALFGGWLTDYLNESEGMAVDEDWHDRARAHMPFVHEGKQFVFLGGGQAGLGGWIATMHDVQIRPGVLGGMMRRRGWESKTSWITPAGGKRFQRRMWSKVVTPVTPPTLNGTAVADEN